MKFSSAKKTRQHVAAKFMKFSFAKKTRQHDVAKFMRLNKMDEFARSVKVSSH